MAVTKALVFAIIVAALLPAGREMLDDLVHEVSSTRQQAVSTPAGLTASVAPAAAGSFQNGMVGDATGIRDVATVSR